jgi:predicted DNA binding protein
MSVIAEFILPLDRFPFGDALDSLEDITVTIGTSVPIGGKHVPFIWVETENFEVFETLASGDEYVEYLVQVDQIEGQSLYRIGWAEEGHNLLEGIREAGAEILEATAREVWNFQVIFFDHTSLTEFANYCRNEPIPIQIERVYRLTDSTIPEATSSLTPVQREALALAMERGYFAIPRTVTAKELGEELGISDTAVIERLRRGVSNLIVSEGVVKRPPEQS